MNTNKQKLLDYYIANYNKKEDTYSSKRVEINKNTSIYVDPTCYNDYKKGDDISSLYLSYIIRGVNVALSAVWKDEPMIDEILEAIGEA